VTTGDLAMMMAWMRNLATAANRQVSTPKKAAKQCAKGRTDGSRAIGHDVDRRHAAEQVRWGYGLSQRRCADDPQDRSGTKQEETKTGEGSRRQPNRKHHQQRAQ
jgi:hypothetical protein